MATNANENHTIREFATHYMYQQPLCIQYPTLSVPFELKFGFIHLLPTFCGLIGKDPHKHLKGFHIVCPSIKPIGITEE